MNRVILGPLTTALAIQPLDRGASAVRDEPLRAWSWDIVSDELQDVYSEALLAAS
jgi:hypothetical protein